MGYWTFEVVLGLLLAGFVIWTWAKQEPRRPLSAEEVAAYCAKVEAAFPVPAGTDRARMVARLRAFAEADNGRDFYMLNLLRFHAAMAEGPDPAARFAGTPLEANAIYEDNARPVLIRSGAFPIFAGKVAGPNVVGGEDLAEDNWDRVLVVHYPSRRHFLNLLTNDQYLTKADFKTYAMHIALVPVHRQLVIPDFRFLAAAGALVVFLAAGWAHALLAGAGQ